MTPEYRRTYETWRAMRRRCLNPNHAKYPIYGGRGITICERWLSFGNFLKDMGYRPEGLTIERVDVNGNYDPFNCIWIPLSDQAKNTRKAIAKRQRLLENPPMEKWERTAIRQISKPSKKKYEPQKPVHGSKKMYLKHRCRCDVCVSAMRTRRARIRANQTPEARQKKLKYLREYHRRKRN